MALSTSFTIRWPCSEHYLLVLHARNIIRFLEKIFITSFVPNHGLPSWKKINLWGEQRILAHALLSDTGNLPPDVSTLQCFIAFFSHLLKTLVVSRVKSVRWFSWTYAGNPLYNTWLLVTSYLLFHFPLSWAKQFWNQVLSYSKSHADHLNSRAPVGTRVDSENVMRPQY